MHFELKLVSDGMLNLSESLILILVIEVKISFCSIYNGANKFVIDGIELRKN